MSIIIIITQKRTMGNIQKRVEVVDMNDCNVGTISNYSDAKDMESLRDSLPNRFTGYEQKMGLKISDYTKYDNGLYLYISRSILMRYLFDMEKCCMINNLMRYLFDMEKCCMINNFKVLNPDVKMYIQMDERLKGKKGDKKSVNLFESENFVVRDGYSCHLAFAFISRHKIEGEFSISADKLLAGPQSFADTLEERNLHIHIKNGSQLGAKRITFSEMIEKERI